MFKSVRKHAFGHPNAATETGLGASQTRGGRKYPEAELQRSVVALLRKGGEWVVRATGFALSSP